MFLVIVQKQQQYVTGSRYLVRYFLRILTSNNGMPLKSGLWIRGHSSCEFTHDLSLKSSDLGPSFAADSMALFISKQRAFPTHNVRLFKLIPLKASLGTVSYSQFIKVTMAVYVKPFP